MPKILKLIQSNESEVEVECPVSAQELLRREADYPIYDFIDFAKRHRAGLFSDVTLNIRGTKHKIQANFCTNPYCRWFGLPQHRYTGIKYKPSRYGLTGSYPLNTMLCQDVPTNEPEGITIPNDYSFPLSNWSLALEIKRLIDINTMKPLEDEYDFHRTDCLESTANPFDNSTSFVKRGKSSSNSQKFQCKTCGKITNVLPEVRECFTYHQKRNDILPTIMRQIVNRTPITRTIEQLEIGSSTYYNKLEWIYRKCLEFNERHETKQLQKMHFDTLWLNTDKLIYFLNNIRKKGHAKDYIEQERLMLPTHIVATTDSLSRYIFRCDVAYDFDVKPEDIENDIKLYKEDKLNTFVQKNARYRHSYYGSRRRRKEDLIDDVADDVLDISYLDLRKDYVDGLHVNSTYTAYAQFWLLKKLLNVDKYNFVCDDDASLINSLMRVFSDEIKHGTTNIFTCQVEKTLSKEAAHREAKLQREELDRYKNSLGSKVKNKTDAAIIMLAEELMTHGFYTYASKNGRAYTIPTEIGPVEHPMPFDDEGIRYINVLTDLSYLEPLELAMQLINVNMRSINTFFNQLRRRSSVLERPLVTSRGQGKSYIYANFNPKYAQYLTTIIRTYINFVDTYKLGKEEITPAMRLGIADRPYTVEDILYFK